jgi:hypothetical protein
LWVTDLEVFVAWVTDWWQPGVVVCANLDGLGRNARNEEREKQSLNKIIKYYFNKNKNKIKRIVGV